MPAAVGGEREAPNSFARIGEAGDDAQQGGLAAARRADEAQELALADIEIDCVEGAQSGAETLPDAAQRNDSQGRIPTFLSTNCSVYALRKSRSLG